MTNEKLLELWRSIPTPDGWQMDDIIVQFGGIVQMETYKVFEATLLREIEELEKGLIPDDAVWLQRADEAQLQLQIERIAQQWDGCMYESVGESIDIGEAIRSLPQRAGQPQHLPAPWSEKQKWYDEGYNDGKELAPRASAATPCQPTGAAHGADECPHMWIANSGTGGEAKFKLNTQLSPVPVMHVKCSRCSDRTWVTQEQWGPEPDHTTHSEPGYPAISRAEWHDKAWSLFHAKAFDDTMLAKVNMHTIRAVFDATFDAMQLAALPSAAPIERGLPADVAQLMQFYKASSLEDLARQQCEHTERLQKRLREYRIEADKVGGVAIHKIITNPVKWDSEKPQEDK